MNITLSHFTSREFVTNILCEGIQLGNVSIGDGRNMRGVGLTKITDPNRQFWIKGRNEPNITLRNSCRIVISLPRNNRLLTWKRFSKQFGIPLKAYQEINRIGGGTGYEWYISLDPIPPHLIKDVWLADEKRMLRSTEYLYWREGQRVPQPSEGGHDWLMGAEVLNHSQPIDVLIMQKAVKEAKLLKRCTTIGG